jgi:uncharacterized protein YcfJ
MNKNEGRTMNRKNTLIILTLLIMAIGSPAALAGHKFKHYEHADHFTDTARVVSVTPIYRTVRIAEPVEECYEEEVTYYDDDYESATPMIAGGILGGILGNQVGRGNGKTFMTIAGTVLGGSIGRDVGVKNRHHEVYDDGTVTRCEVIDRYREEEELDGYDVTYRYRGELFDTTLPYHPGKKLKVNVTVRPYD